MTHEEETRGVVVEKGGHVVCTSPHHTPGHGEGPEASLGFDGRGARARPWF